MEVTPAILRGSRPRPHVTHRSPSRWGPQLVGRDLKKLRAAVERNPELQLGRIKATGPSQNTFVGRPGRRTNCTDYLESPSLIEREFRMATETAAQSSCTARTPESGAHPSSRKAKEYSPRRKPWGRTTENRKLRRSERNAPTHDNAQAALTGQERLTTSR
jgi:hypothetical protein